jgi:hypothetical protein
MTISETNMKAAKQLAKACMSYVDEEGCIYGFGLTDYTIEIAAALQAKDDEIAELVKALHRLESIFSRDGSFCEQINPEQNKVLVSQARAIIAKHKEAVK